MNRPTPRLTSMAAVCATVLALLSAACAGKQKPQGEIAASDAVSVDVGTLWKKEAATDPITAYRIRIAGDPDKDRKSTRLNSSHIQKSRMPSSA